jgi:hypothetical protein
LWVVLGCCQAGLVSWVVWLVEQGWGCYAVLGWLEEWGQL